MIRRFTLALCALLGAASLAACTTVDHNDVVASIDGTELSQDDFGAMLESQLGADLLNSKPDDGVMDGPGARGLISAWIGLTAIDHSGLVASADRTQIASQLTTQFGAEWTDAPQQMQELAITNVAVGNAVQAGELAQEEVQAALAGVDVFVDSRYGAWDPDNVTVVALG